MASDNLNSFVHNAIFLRQVRTVEEIHKQARKNRINVSRGQVYRAIEEVCTPYKARR